MSLQLKDIELIEQYLLGKCSAGAKKQVEERITSDPGFSAMVQQMKLTVLVIQDAGKQAFKQNMAAIEAAGSAAFKPYKPGSGGGGSSSGIAGKSFFVVTIIAGFTALYFYLNPLSMELTQPFLPSVNDTVPETIVKEKTVKNVLPDPVKQEISIDTIQQVERRVKVITRVIEVDTVIEAGTAFDTVEYVKSLQPALKKLKGDTVIERKEIEIKFRD